MLFFWKRSITHNFARPHTMLDYLEKLRQKPPHVRKRFALLSTCAIFSVIVMVWWTTWSAPVTEGSNSLANVVTPLGVVANVASAARDGLRKLPEQITSSLSSSTSATSKNTDQQIDKGGGTNDIVYPDQVFPKSLEQRTIQATDTTGTVNNQ